MSAKLGLIGFGRFGQFLANNLKQNFTITATSIENYFELAKEMKIKYCYVEEFVKENYDYLIIATSIISTPKVIENIIKKYPDFFTNQLVIDVLSVKLLPSILLEKINNLYPKLDILLTHPMFGPDSAQISWEGKKFVYFKKNITNEVRCRYFLNTIKEKGCHLISITPQNHDEITSNSQFLTHLIGRILENLDPKPSIIDTDGYSSLIKLVNQTKNDSWDLFKGLYQQNPYSDNILNKIISSTFSLKYKLNPEPDFLSKTILLNEEFKKKDIKKNLSAGIPSWIPNSFPRILDEDNIYAPSNGNPELIKKISAFMEKNHQINLLNRDILITNGGKQGIHLTIKGLTRPGNKWLIFKPYWPSFKDIIELEYGYLKELEFFDRDELIKELKDETTVGLIIIRPNNPDNNDYSTSLYKIIDLVKKYNKYLLCDEVYLPLTNLSSVINHEYPKIISVGSFSKAWGMTGWRVGWLILPKELLSKIKGILSTIHGSVGHYNMKVALEQLDNYQIPKLELQKNKMNLIKELNQFIPEINQLEKYPDSIGLYLYIKYDYNKLIEKGYGICPSEIFGEEGYCRLSIIS